VIKKANWDKCAVAKHPTNEGAGTAIMNWYRANNG
jgi:hypothetical protein